MTEPLEEREMIRGKEENHRDVWGGFEMSYAMFKRKGQKKIHEEKNGRRLPKFHKKIKNKLIFID